MPSKGRHTRRPLLPPEDFAERAITVTRQPQRTWFRIHVAGSNALDFSLRAHHRFSHSDSPFPVLYVAASLRTCLWEMFGDDLFQNERVIGRSRWDAYSVSEIVVPELPVCAVTLEKTRSTMAVDKASLLAGDLSVPQAWGLAVQNHSRNFAALKYHSRFVDQACLALFDRDDIRRRLKTATVGRLTELDYPVDWLEDQQAALV